MTKHGRRKKCEKNDINKLIKEEKKFASELKVADRIDVPAQSEAYINLKDHKPNFRNNPSFRLLNTNKGNLGLISQKILKRVNGNIRSILEVNQWTNTQDVLKWFNSIQNKTKKHFIQFDIVDYYPSITEDLLRRALDFARENTQI